MFGDRMFNLDRKKSTIARANARPNCCVTATSKNLPHFDRARERSTATSIRPIDCEARSSRLCAREGGGDRNAICQMKKNKKSQL